jgi:hypothetical protein
MAAEAEHSAYSIPCRPARGFSISVSKKIQPPPKLPKFVRFGQNFEPSASGGADFSLSPYKKRSASKLKSFHCRQQHDVLGWTMAMMRRRRVGWLIQNVSCGVSRSVTRAVFRSPIRRAEFLLCALNAHCSNSFIFSKNYPNFD